MYIHYTVSKAVKGQSHTVFPSVVFPGYKGRKLISFRFFKSQKSLYCSPPRIFSKAVWRYVTSSPLIISKTRSPVKNEMMYKKGFSIQNSMLRSERLKTMWPYYSYHCDTKLSYALFTIIRVDCGRVVEWLKTHVSANEVPGSTPM